MSPARTGVGFLALILLGILFFSATSEALVDGVTRVFANESEILRAPIKKMIYDSSSNRLFAAATGNVIFRINPDTMMVTHTRTLSRAGSSSSSDEPVNLFINGIFLYYVARPFRATKPIWYSVLMSDLTGGNSGLFSDFETPRSLSACSDATRILLFSFATQTEYKYFNFDNGSFTGVGNFGSENREINSAGCYGSSETGILGWSYSSGDNAIQHLLLRPSGSNLDVYTVMSSPTVDNAQEGPFAGTTINIPPNRFYFPGDLFHHSFNGSHSVFMPYQSRVSAGSALIEFRIPVTSDLDSTRYSPTAVSFFPDDPDFSTVTVSSITNTSGVIFFGTSAGKVKKYRYQYTTFVGHLSSTKKAYNFSAAYSDDFLGEARNEVTASVLDKSTSPPRVFYASSATSGGIWKVPLYDCSTRTTCSSCLAMGDPFCGWCPLSGTCSDKAGCPTSALENGWLQGSQCPSITVRGDAGTTTFAGNNEFGIEIVPAFFPPPVEATKSSYSVDVIRSSGPPLAFSLFDVFAGPPKYIRGNLPVIDAPLANPFNESLSFSIYYNGILIATSENSATLYDCGYFQGCSSCLQASSSYECGWCTLDNKCTSNFGCIELSALPNAWNTGSSCPAIAEVSDDNFPFDTPTSLSVVVSAIPDSASTGGSYSCRFTRELKGEMADTNATVSTYSGAVPNATLVTCTTPKYGSNTLVSRDREDVTIAVWYTPDGGSAFELAAANPASKVMAFDCTTKTTCAQCVAQNFSCGWDARNGVCGTWELGLAKDAEGCPVITGIQPEHVSSSVPTTMTITGANLPAPSVRKRAGKEFYCLFSSGQKVVATWEDDSTLTCNTPVLFTDNTGVLANITLTILYGDEVLPSQASFPGVTFVSCTVFSESCILCTQESQTLGSVCGWCDGLSSCTPEASCNSSWADTQNDCSGPTLSAPVPLTGPTQGGTRIVISGNNLPDALVFVTLNSQFCSDPVWINTKTISCVTPPMTAGSFSIVAQFGDDPVTSDTQFTYVPDPQILSFAPAQGPISGGTEIVINGTNMDSGLNVSLSIGTTPCQITQRTATEIRCTTPSVASASSSKLVLTIDLAEAESEDSFRFRANPAIIQFSPVEGPASAQFELVFQGTDLDLAVPTAIMADIGNGNITVTPTVIPGDLDSLSLKLPDCCGDRQIPDSGLFHRITFDFAGYTVQAPIYYKFYPNPKIDDFAPNEGAVEGGTVVFIEGSNLARGAEPTVTISGVPCNVTFASDVLVKCTTGPQEASDETGRLILTIGAASTMAVGSFAYKKTGLPTWVIPVIIAVSVAVLIAIVVGAVLYRRQVKKGRKRAAHLFAELDKANETSMNVLSEVMEAYTEYNTRGKFSNPLYNNKPIPLTPFDLFALETLFPRDESLSPPALINFSTQSKTLQDLKAFKQLMMKEEFAIIFFKTMESQPEFKLADRKYSAALFMIGLRTEIGHATNLLFSLLRDYISQKVRSGEQKTILRATSTVTEKLLTAWLAFTLHDFVSERLSKPLFALFMAIKSQIEKGAVDCVTGSSQYTLNASTILRQKVQYERIKIKAFLSDKSAEVEVNTCDSISQVVAAALFALDEPVKQNQYSLTDAEGRQLKDIDGTNDRDGEWIKVNTVAHYGLKEGSQIKLLKKNGQDSQATGTNLYHLEKKSEHDPDQKVAPSEVFFTRMMTMREFIRTQVDDLFTAIFDIKDEPPLPIKILFDFLDRTAKELGIEDPETVHIWKNNSLALRFWVNLVTNPNQLLGVTKTASVHNSFSTIGQVLMDSCSTSESKLGPGAPASKLLYKNEVDEYKGLVTRYYAHVHASPPIERPHIPIPQTTGDRLDENSAMSELQGYGKKFQAAVAEALEKAHKDELKSQFLASTPSS